MNADLRAQVLTAHVETRGGSDGLRRRIDALYALATATRALAATVTTDETAPRAKVGVFARDLPGPPPPLD